MKAMYLIKTLSFITLATFTGCMDNDVYNADNEKENENAPGLVVPPNFTWSTTTKVAVNVTTGDKSDHTYAILVYPQGATEKTYPLISGTAKKGVPFNGTITVPASDTIVSIVKTMKYNSGSNLRLEWSAPINNGKVTVDFSNLNDLTTRAANITTRGINSGDLENWANMTELTEKITLKNDGQYKVSEGKSVIITELDFSKNAKIYVAGVLQLKSGIILNNSNKGNEIIILEKSAKSEKGGLLKSDGNITLKNELKVINYGNINIQGTLIIRDDSEVETEGCIYAKRIELAEQGQGGILDIKEGGYVDTESMYMEKSKVKLDRNAYLHIEGELTCKNDNEIDGESTKSSIAEVGSISKVQGQTNKILKVNDAFIVCEKSKPDFANLTNALWGNRNAAADDGAKTEGSDCANFDPEEDNTGGDTKPEEVVTSPGVYTYAFEDQWPHFGDYDMNDLILQTEPKIYSVDNIVKKVVLNCKIMAIGATKTIAAAVQWDDVLPNSISSIEYDTTNNFGEDLFEHNPNGTEKNQSTAVVPLFDNAHIFAGAHNNSITGTHTNSNYTAKEFNVTILLNSNTITPANFELGKWNYFITCNTTKGKRMEVHMKSDSPSDLFDSSLSKGDVQSSQNPFVAKGNYCWVMCIPNSFSFPLENNKLWDSFKDFNTWLTDDSYDWYNHPIDGKIK